MEKKEVSQSGVEAKLDSKGGIGQQPYTKEFKEENTQLKMKLEFLKKATVYFAK